MKLKGRLLLLSAILLLAVTGCGKGNAKDKKEEVTTETTESESNYHSNLDVTVVSSLNNMQFPLLTSDLEQITLYNPDDMDETLWENKLQSFYFDDMGLYFRIFDRNDINEEGIIFQTAEENFYPFKQCTFDEPTCICNGSRCVYTDGTTFLYEAYNDTHVTNAKSFGEAGSFVKEIDNFSSYIKDAEINGELHKSVSENEIVLWCPVKFKINAALYSSSGLINGVFYLRQTNEKQYIYIATVQSFLEPSEDDYGFMIDKISFQEKPSDILSQGTKYDTEIWLRGSYPIKITCPESFHLLPGTYSNCCGNVSYNSGIAFEASVIYLYGELDNISTDEYLQKYYDYGSEFRNSDIEVFENIDGCGTEVTKCKMPALDCSLSVSNNFDNNGLSFSDGMRYLYLIRHNRYIYRFFVDTLYNIDEQELDNMFKSFQFTDSSEYEDTTLKYFFDRDLYSDYLIEQGICSSEEETKEYIYTMITGIENPCEHRPPASSSTAWDNPWYTYDEILEGHNWVEEDDEIAQGIVTPPYDENVDGPPAWNAAWEAEQQEQQEQENLEHMEEIDESYYE